MVLTIKRFSINAYHQLEWLLHPYANPYDLTSIGWTIHSLPHLPLSSQHKVEKTGNFLALLTISLCVFWLTGCATTTEWPWVSWNTYLWKCPLKRKATISSVRLERLLDLIRPGPLQTEELQNFLHCLRYAWIWASSFSHTLWLPKSINRSDSLWALFVSFYAHIVQPLSSDACLKTLPRLVMSSKRTRIFTWSYKQLLT